MHSKVLGLRVIQSLILSLRTLGTSKMLSTGSSLPLS